MARALVPLAAGFEEIEAVTLIDILRRAQVTVVAASLGARAVAGSHGIRLEADTTLADLPEEPFDLIALPGGMPGAANLAAEPRLTAMLRAHAAAGRLTGAICAAPLVLARAGLLAGRRATSFPGVLAREAVPGLALTNDSIVVDGHLVTSRGPGTALDFSLKLVELLCGRARAGEVEAQLERQPAVAVGS
jgi:4-methyl-5(b-hydroxyethyl)-thiazole monophosphate biosynthesis